MITTTEISREPQFYITGISVRTINQGGRSAADIGDLWTRFMSENLIDKIEDKETNDLYCVYTNYETDHTGPYTAILGCKVRSFDNVCEGFARVIVPAGKFQVHSLCGEFPNNIGCAWRQIWDSGVKRTYTADYDLYKSNAKSFAETEAIIYLAVG
ncbi:MAG TPA: GyrI-like domain-containing protein [Mucilaginibacter sp.]